MRTARIDVPPVSASGTIAPMSVGLGWRLLWAGVVLTALALIGDGLLSTVFFEPTGEALAQARSGRLVLLLGCVVLVAAALTARTLLRTPTWAWVSVLVPVVLIGGLALVAGGTLFPQLSVIVSGPAALAGVIGGVVAPRRRR